MLKGLYNGAAALNVLAQQQELISHNLSNVNTQGYRSAQIAVDQRDIQQRTHLFNDLGPKIAQKRLNFSSGRSQPTGRALDAAISGDGFFVFDGPNGELYSRAGKFFRDTETGDLVTEDGYKVLGENGPINLPQDVGDSQITIDGDGTISGAGQQLGKLRIVSFDDNHQLNSLTQSLFEATPQSRPNESEAMVLQFHQEYSNSHPINQLVSMISGMRQYEAIQKAASTMAETLQEHIKA